MVVAGLNPEMEWNETESHQAVCLRWNVEAQYRLQLSMQHDAGAVTDPEHSRATSICSHTI